MGDEIEIRLTGEGIRPGLVRSHEIAEILQAVEDMVIAEALRREPSVARETFVVGLYQVADRSLGLRFKISLASVGVPAFVAASTAIGSGDFNALSPHSFRPLNVIAGFAKRHGATAEFKLPDSIDALGSITPDTKIPDQPRITGVTELAAKILRVGGKVPRAMLEMLDGTVIYCAIPVALAIELGHRLYEVATLTGVATWNAATLEIEDFAITAFSPFAQRAADDMFVELRGIIGPEIERLGNVDELVNRLRREGDDE